MGATLWPALILRSEGHKIMKCAVGVALHVDTTAQVSIVFLMFVFRATYVVAVFIQQILLSM